MHIMFFMGDYPNFGGVEMVSTVLANRFIEDGHSVTITSFVQSNPEFVKGRLSDKCHLLYLAPPILSKENERRLKEYIVQNRIGVIINQWVVPFYATRLWDKATKDTNCRVISVHHNQPDTNARIQALDLKIASGAWWMKPIRWGVREVSRFSLRYCIEKSAKYVVLSPSFIPIAQKYARDKHNDKYLSIANPITIHTPEKPILFEGKRNVVICVGRIEYNQKRTFRIVDIWKEVENRFPKWELFFVGDGPDRSDLEERIAEAGLKNVHITGFTNPIDYYRDAKILIQTSEYEGFPLVLAESMAYGVVPLVYGSYESVHDIIENELTGCITSSPFNGKVMQEKMTGLIEDPDGLKRMSNAVQESSRRFCVDSIVSQWYSLFQSI